MPPLATSYSSRLNCRNHCPAPAILQRNVRSEGSLVLIMLRELGLFSSQKLIVLVGLMEAEIADWSLTDAALRS